MKKWILFFVIIVCGIIQVSFLNYLRFFYVKPDLLLVSAITAALLLKPARALAAVILAGILKDSFSSGTFALNTILFVIWYFLILRLTREISIENDYIRLAIFLIIVFLHHLILGLALFYSGQSIPLGIFLRTLIIVTVYTTAITPLFFRFLDSLAERKL